MTQNQITEEIRQILARVANLDPARITPEASFRQDLAIDSLALLEAGVDVDYAFKLAIPELDDMLREIDTLDEMSKLVAGLIERRDQVVAA